jgi:hypothetical protein
MDGIAGGTLREIKIRTHFAHSFAGSETMVPAPRISPTAALGPPDCPRRRRPHFAIPAGRGRWSRGFGRDGPRAVPLAKGKAAIGFRPMTAFYLLHQKTASIVCISVVNDRLRDHQPMRQFGWGRRPRSNKPTTPAA